MDMDHDHDHSGGGDGSTSSSACPMIMVFHGGHCERILWSGWVASTVTEFAFSCLAFFLLAMIYESLKFVREHFLRKSVRNEVQRITLELQSKNACTGECSNPAFSEMQQKTYMQRIFSSHHIIQALINIIQVAISYLLMLVFMNYNYWLCLSVILGLGLGYFFFGWMKQDVYENECCQ